MRRVNGLELNYLFHRKHGGAEFDANEPLLPAYPQSQWPLR
jgi:hypothetical protein